jgi:hypothetical protein
LPVLGARYRPNLPSLTSLVISRRPVYGVTTATANLRCLCCTGESLPYTVNGSPTVVDYRKPDLCHSWLLGHLPSRIKLIILLHLEEGSMPHIWYPPKGLTLAGSV